MMEDKGKIADSNVPASIADIRRYGGNALVNKKHGRRRNMEEDRKINPGPKFDSPRRCMEYESRQA